MPRNLYEKFKNTKLNSRKPKKQMNNNTTEINPSGEHQG